MLEINDKEKHDEISLDEVVSAPEFEPDEISSKAKDSEYIPREHRETTHATSNLDTAIHLLKGNIGTGILAIPEAFKHSGLVVGIFGLIAIVPICLHSMHLLLFCAKYLCARMEKPFLDFASVGENSFKVGPPYLRKYAKHASIAVDSILACSQIGYCCVYFVFVATSLQKLLQENGYEVSLSTCLAAFLLPLILTNWIRNLKPLAKVIMVGNLLMIVSLGIIFYYIFRDIPSLKNRKGFHLYFASFSQLPLYFGTVMYAFEGIGMILPLENKMAKPQDLSKWNGVLNSSMIVVAMLYLSVGVFGYLKYGEECTGSITLNLPQGEIAAVMVRVFMFLSIFLSYSLQFYVAMSVIWPPVERRLSSRVKDMPIPVAEFSFRTLLVMLTFLLGWLIPNLGLFITLVGALCTSLLGLMLPPLFNICVHYEIGYGLGKWRLWKDISIILVGVIGAVTGTYISLLDIAKEYAI